MKFETLENFKNIEKEWIRMNDYIRQLRMHVDHQDRYIDYLNGYIEFLKSSDKENYFESKIKVDSFLPDECFDKEHSCKLCETIK